MPRSLRLQLGNAASLAGIVLVSVSLAGCRQDMQDQPKMFPLRSTTFYQDGRSVRPQVVGTVARSQSQAASYFATGLINGAEGDGLPFKATLAVLERGQERFNIYCTPCHSRVGNGKGMIVQRGYYPATSFHSYRLKQAPLGHFFSVITNGYGAMPDYAAQIAPQDRWAIAAYIRALQLSQDAADTDVPSGERVTPMNVVLERSGFSEDFLGPWLGSSAQHVHPTAEAATPAPSTPAQAPPTRPSTVTALQPAAPATTKAAGKNIEVASAAKPAAPQSSAPAKESAPAAEKPAAKGDAEHGKTLYANNCSVCHQPTRAGMPPVFPSLIGVVDRVGEKKVRTVAKDGIPDAKPPMPPHPDLTDKDLTDLIAFLRTK